MRNPLDPLRARTPVAGATVAHTLQIGLIPLGTAHDGLNDCSTRNRDNLSKNALPAASVVLPRKKEAFAYDC